MNYSEMFPHAEQELIISINKTIGVFPAICRKIKKNLWVQESVKY